MKTKFFVTTAIIAISAFAIAQTPGPGGPGQTPQQGQGRPGSGQNKPGAMQRAGGGTAGLMMLMNPKVQTEINLTAEQKQAITQVMTELGLGAKARGQGGEKPKGEQQRGQMAEMQQKMQKAEAAIKEILTPEQERRIEQLILQQQGPQAIGQNPKLQDQLQLTQPQRVAIQEIQKANRQEMQNLVQGGNKEAFADKLREMREQMGQKILAVLTPEQKSIWANLLGKPFDFKRK